VKMERNEFPPVEDAESLLPISSTCDLPLNQPLS